MSEGNNEGGPAFPGQDIHRIGLSKREYFAAKALSGVVAGRAVYQLGGIEPHYPIIADFCFRLADEMLKRREQE